MHVPSFITLLTFDTEIVAVEESDTGFIVKYDNGEISSIKCDILTAYYYGKKLNYDLMYEKSVNREILDYLMTNIKTPVDRYSCTFDNVDKFVITFDGISIKCEAVNREFKNDVDILVDYLRMMDELEEIQNFVDQCLDLPNLIKECGTYTISYNDQKLESLTKTGAQTIISIIKKNIPRNRRNRLYKKLLLFILVLFILMFLMIWM
jgi:hypothetical protein